MRTVIFVSNYFCVSCDSPVATELEVECNCIINYHSDYDISVPFTLPQMGDKFSYYLHDFGINDLI